MSWTSTFHVKMSREGVVLFPWVLSASASLNDHPLSSFLQSTTNIYIYTLTLNWLLNRASLERDDDEEEDVFDEILRPGTVPTAENVTVPETMGHGCLQFFNSVTQNQYVSFFVFTCEHYFTVGLTLLGVVSPSKSQGT